LIAIPRRAIALAHRAILLAALLMGISSYFAYTTVGFDFEVDNGVGVDARYYRLRWDDGSTWVGMAIQPCARPSRPLDWFDPGGTILDPPRRPAHPRWWNALGFWRVTSPADDPYVATSYLGAKASSWWGCPSWLVVLALWGRTPWRLALAGMTRLLQANRRRRDGHDFPDRPGPASNARVTSTAVAR
jgi:hypothetical protein